MTLVDHFRNVVGKTSHDARGDATAFIGPATIENRQGSSLVPFHPRTGTDIPVGPLAERGSLNPAEDDSPDPATSTPDSQNIVHDVLKGLDVWFKFEVSGLEKEATQQAQLWADHGLPRHDLEVGEPLEVERVLVGRALEVYWNWIRKARRRVTGAINREVRQVSQALADGVIALESYRRSE